MPAFHEESLLDLIKQLVTIDQAWIPSAEGTSLYIRPTAIAMDAGLYLAEPTTARLYVICSPVGPYFPQGGMSPVKLFASTDRVRAWPGGMGDAKVRVGGGGGGRGNSTEQAGNKCSWN